MYWFPRLDFYRRSINNRYLLQAVRAILSQAIVAPETVADGFTTVTFFETEAVQPLALTTVTVYIPLLRTVLTAIFE
jgi:hypothetical protein